jgi:hypothetical protein
MWHVWETGKGYVYMVLVGRSEAKRLLRRYRRRRGIIFKRIIKTWDGEA